MVIGGVAVSALRFAESLLLRVDEVIQ